MRSATSVWRWEHPRSWRVKCSAWLGGVGRWGFHRGKSQFLMGKSAISMAIFNSKLLNYQGVTMRNDETLRFKHQEKDKHGMVFMGIRGVSITRTIRGIWQETWPKFIYIWYLDGSENWVYTRTPPKRKSSGTWWTSRFRGCPISRSSSSSWDIGIFFEGFWET